VAFAQNPIGVHFFLILREGDGGGIFKSIPLKQYTK
jgi:hypothetical protein